MVLIMNRIILVTFLCFIGACNTTSMKPDTAVNDKTDLVDTTVEQQLTTEKNTDEQEMNKVVCKKQVPIGSLIGTRTCLTRRQWLGLQKQGQKMLENTTRKSVTTQNMPGS